MLVPDSLHTFEFCRQHLVLLAYDFGAKFQRKIQILMLVPGACHLSRSLPCIFLPLNDAELRSVKRQWPTPLRWFLIGQRSNRSTSYDSSRKSIWPRVQSGPPMLSHFDYLWNNFQYQMKSFYVRLTIPENQFDFVYILDHQFCNFWLKMLICKETMTNSFEMIFDRPATKSSYNSQK